MQRYKYFFNFQIFFKNFLKNFKNYFFCKNFIFANSGTKDNYVPYITG